jgi:hypothetical protein
MWGSHDVWWADRSIKVDLHGGEHGSIWMRRRWAPQHGLAARQGTTAGAVVK